MLVFVSVLEQNREEVDLPMDTPLRREIVQGVRQAERIVLIDLADRRFDEMRRLMVRMLDDLDRPDDDLALPSPVDSRTRVRQRSGDTRGTGLTPREREVLHLSAEGHSYDAIAEALRISVNTVRYHMKRMNMKLNVSNRVAAIHRARALGLV